MNEKRSYFYIFAYGLTKAGTKRMENSISCENLERDKALASSYNELIEHLGARIELISKQDLFTALGKMPAPRFYICVERCSQMLNRLERKGSHSDKEGRELASKARMYGEIKRRVDKLVGGGLSRYDAIDRVVHSPAPEYYISGGHAQLCYRRIVKENPEFFD